jgi:hypothetical protein
MNADLTNIRNLLREVRSELMQKQNVVATGIGYLLNLKSIPINKRSGPNRPTNRNTGHPNRYPLPTHSAGLPYACPGAAFGRHLTPWEH